MAMQVSSSEYAFEVNVRSKGLSEQDRSLIYRRAGLMPFQARDIEQMVADSGHRVVGKGALNNVVVRLA